MVSRTAVHVVDVYRREADHRPIQIDGAGHMLVDEDPVLMFLEYLGQPKCVLPTELPPVIVADTTERPKSLNHPCPAVTVCNIARACHYGATVYVSPQELMMEMPAVVWRDPAVEFWHQVVPRVARPSLCRVVPVHCGAFEL